VRVQQQRCHTREANPKISGVWRRKPMKLSRRWERSPQKQGSTNSYSNSSNFVHPKSMAAPFACKYHILQGESLGVTTDKLNLVVVWREAPMFSARERAALAWTEALTLVTEGVSDDVYAQVRAEFSDRELAYISAAVGSINVWNRLGAAYRWTPSRRPKAAAAAAS
jgi:hypothetical protein